MGTNSRRHFLQISAAAVVGAGIPEDLRMGGRAPSADGLTMPAASAKPLRLGLIVGIDNDPESAIKKVHDLGVPTCQVSVGTFGLDLVNRLRSALDLYKIEATSLVIGFPGPEVYDFYQGPETIGLVPWRWREARIEASKKASDFAKQCGIPAIQGHCGFIPENPNDGLYKETVNAIREVASYAKQNGQSFRYETGQETPITMLRAIQDVGLDNQGVNFDCANLIMYGKAYPVDALDVIGKYVQGVHAKDGLWPANPKELGEEVPIGKGKVDFPRVIEKLRALNYTGTITIEREISGPQQMEDIRKEKEYLEQLIG